MKAEERGRKEKEKREKGEWRVEEEEGRDRREKSGGRRRRNERGR